MARNGHILKLGITCFRLVALSPGEVPWAPVRLARPTRRLHVLARR
jgi:hypothetical protein